MGLYSLLCCSHCIDICHASYVIVVVKESSHEFREGTRDLFQAQSGDLEIRVGVWCSNRGLGSYEEPNV